jgi:thiamine-monophosphate kinase
MVSGPSRLGPGPEFDLIRGFFGGEAASSGPGVRVGPGDDCAVVAGDGIALTVDMAVEDVHFRRSWLGPSEIGYRSAAGAISDLAAVAARPIGILASVALGPGDEAEFGPAVMAGVVAAAADAGAILLGGDLTRSPGPLVVDIVAVGEAPTPVLRSGAEAGDEVWVTGELGAAAVAVAAWLDGREPDPAARAAYVCPAPRIREALWLAQRAIPTAMVDLSDGIAGDAGHIAAASGVRVVVRAGALPVAEVASAAASTAGELVRLAAAGGEDYELCFTARAGTVAAVAGEFEERFGVRLTLVGEVTAGEGGGSGAGSVEGSVEAKGRGSGGGSGAGQGDGSVVVVDEAGDPILIEGYQHWRRS